MTPTTTGTIPLPPHGGIEAVAERSASVFNWSYDMRREALVQLYEMGKRLQWNASTDIDWSIDVDPVTIPSMIVEYLAGAQAYVR